MSKEAGQRLLMLGLIGGMKIMMIWSCQISG